tara:strand:+ start:102 stop:416 length:315 start_codon:yes stop_codon:yes gene_type:complete
MNDTNQQDPNNEWSKREVGALWLKQGSSQKYFSGHVRMEDEFGAEKTMRLVVFSNKHKTKPNQPDFRIYLSKDRQEAQPEQEAAVSTASSQPSGGDNSSQEDTL